MLPVEIRLPNWVPDMSISHARKADAKPCPNESVPYFFVSAILFSMSYLSLILFRRRERVFPAHLYRCPFGEWQAGILIAIHVAIAGSIAYRAPRDALGSLGVLAFLAVAYLFWNRTKRGQRLRRDSHSADR